MTRYFACPERAQAHSTKHSANTFTNKLRDTNNIRPGVCAGSELSLAVEAAKEIEASGKKARVVSMVSWELFDEQDQAYKTSVLPPDVTARVS